MVFFLATNFLLMKSTLVGKHGVETHLSTIFLYWTLGLDGKNVCMENCCLLSAYMLFLFFILEC